MSIPAERDADRRRPRAQARSTRRTRRSTRRHALARSAVRRGELRRRAMRCARAANSPRSSTRREARDQPRRAARAAHRAWVAAYARRRPLEPRAGHVIARIGAPWGGICQRPTTRIILDLGSRGVPERRQADRRPSNSNGRREDGRSRSPGAAAGEPRGNQTSDARAATRVPPRRHYADHDMRRLVEGERAADHVAPAAVVALPHFVAQHDDRGRAGLGVGGRKAAAEQRRNAQQHRQPRGDAHPTHDARGHWRRTRAHRASYSPRHLRTSAPARATTLQPSSVERLRTQTVGWKSGDIPAGRNPGTAARAARCN